MLNEFDGLLRRCLWMEENLEGRYRMGRRRCLKKGKCFLKEGVGELKRLSICEWKLVYLR